MNRNFGQAVAVFTRRWWGFPSLFIRLISPISPIWYMGAHELV